MRETGEEVMSVKASTKSNHLARSGENAERERRLETGGESRGTGSHEPISEIVSDIYVVRLRRLGTDRPT